MKLAIIDWNSITMNRLYSLKSGKEPVTRTSEISEIVYRIARTVYALKKEFQWDACILCMDDRGNYWRKDHMSNYYSKNTKLYSQDGVQYAKFDNTLYKIELSATEDTWVGKKLTKKDTPKDLEEVEDIDTLMRCVKELVPKYKGNRSKTPWTFSTDKAKVYEAFELVAKAIAPLVGGAVVAVPKVEADDIGAIACQTAPEDYQKILITVDSDWKQIAAHTPNTTFYDLGKNEILPPSQERDIEIIRDTLVKIVSGDKSDSVSGTFIEGKAGCIGEVTASKIVEGSDEKLQLGFVDKKALQKNNELIRLDIENLTELGIAPIIQEALRNTEFQEPKSKWEDFTLTKLDRKIIDEKHILSEILGGN